GASIGRCWRRLIGAPTAPPPPRYAIRRRASSTRVSPRASAPRGGEGAQPAQVATAPGENCGLDAGGTPARRDQVRDGLPAFHAARLAQVHGEWDLLRAAFHRR